MRSYWIRWTIFVLCFLAACGGLVKAQTDEKSRVVKSRFVNLHDYLTGLGKNFPCHFTIEQVRGERPPLKGERLPQIDEAKVADLKAASVKDLAAELSEKIDEFNFIQNEKNGRVIHVIEKRLSELESYAIQRKIDLEFSGTPHGLNRALGEKLPSIGPKTSGDFRQVFDDNRTKISVDAKDQVVRDILTDCSSWEGYHPLLWRAETALDTGETTVQFYGALD